MTSVLARAMQALRSLISQTGAQLKIDPLPVVAGDATMLAQLLQKARVNNVRALPIDTVENMLNQVEEGRFAIVCVSALPPFAVGQARSLCKRLRGRFKNIAVVVGLWGFAGGVPKAQDRIGAACTDCVCTNFSEAFFHIQKLAEPAGSSEEQSQNLEQGKPRPRVLAS